MDKKLTDAEIIKAFNNALVFDGMNVYLWSDKEEKVNVIPLKRVADLINRLQAENERLKNTLDDVLDRQPILVERSEKYAKTEAYKEFAERLKAKAMAKYKTIDNEYLYEFDNNFIDNLLKELVGDK